jgi:hypothetical protein
MTAPLDDPLRRVADLPPPADQAAATRAVTEAAASRAVAELEPALADEATDELRLSDDMPAGQAVGVRLGAMLDHVLTHEPPVGDAVADIFRRADAVRRRRARTVVGVGSAAIVLITVLGYALTTVLLPAAPTQAPAAEIVAGPAVADPVLTVLKTVLAQARLTAVPREPARGKGWRQYLAMAPNGRPHGLVEVSVYAAPAGLCFPVLADKSACARPEIASATVEFVRYAFDRDVDWQVNEAIARRLPDGRVVVVQATGERGTGSAQAGRPPLTGQLAALVAADPRTAAGFGAGEVCNGPDPACPVLKVPVPVME